MSNGNDKPGGVAGDMLDALKSATKKWTRQRKSEERHPGNIRYRVSRLTREPRVTQKQIAWEVMEECYEFVSGPRNLPAKVRQIYYAARPKIMAETEDKELAYNYFSQTLLPDYIEENGCDHWNVVYDARGHFEEPHTNRRLGVGTLEVRNYLAAIKAPEVVAAGFVDANIDIVGPEGGYGAVMYCEKEGFDPLFKAIDLANRYDLMIISNKGISVTAARKLIDAVCDGRPLFVLTDFDFDGFKNFGTVWRDSRRYAFANEIEVVALGLRLEDIVGLEREPAATTKVNVPTRCELLRGYGASEAEIEILLNERVELNAMASEALVQMIERKLRAHGVSKVIPDDDVLAEAYRAFHFGDELRREFEDLKADLEAEGRSIRVPKNLKAKVDAILTKHPDLRWDEAVQIVLDGNQLDRVREEKAKARRKSGDFTDIDDEDENE